VLDEFNLIPFPFKGGFEMSSPNSFSTSFPKQLRNVLNAA